MISISFQYKWISLVCLLTAALPRGYAQDLLSRVKADYVAKDKQYDRLPSFGPNALSLAGYLVENLPYPAAAVTDRAAGQVLIRFTVDKAGAVRDVEVLQGAREDLNQAVVEAFTRMPRWKPAVQKDAPAEARLLFLVAFNLHNDPYITQYRTDWLLSVGITSDQARPDVRFLLDEDRKQLPPKRSLLIRNEESGKSVNSKADSFQSFNPPVLQFLTP